MVPDPASFLDQSYRTAAIFGSVKQGIKPNIMAISTMMLGVSVLFVSLSYLINRKGRQSP